MDLFAAITQREKRSLASKYLHFHVPHVFYLYDSRARRAITKVVPRLNNLPHIAVKNKLEEKRIRRRDGSAMPRDRSLSLDGDDAAGVEGGLVVQIEHEDTKSQSAGRYQTYDAGFAVNPLVWTYI
jgi:hypothetical protein